ncbi:MAG: hypothetical protein GOVbin52_50 [Prokaryotic dsDNA virus sp.]|nr:MAG: hypothetical protein GOVbin52_50 [Prokaryotic dsDNA virus sp.]HBX95001.1 hypothetical protein [Hyphomonas sp.]|tara:strand:+ start:13969 stop:14166 length:198 start_codon:yes stop_codon:yes gene_type:complete
MSRYFTKPAARGVDSTVCYDDFAPLPAFTVHEDERETWTGLLDADGREIHRSERVRMGFIVRSAD